MSFTFGPVKIGVIGLGYVGLPQAIEFGRKFNILGFDINYRCVEKLKKLVDKTLECSAEKLEAVANLPYSATKEDLNSCNV